MIFWGGERLGPGLRLSLGNHCRFPPKSTIDKGLFPWLSNRLQLTTALQSIWGNLVKDGYQNAGGEGGISAPNDLLPSSMKFKDRDEPSSCFPLTVGLENSAELQNPGQEETPNCSGLSCT